MKMTKTIVALALLFGCSATTNAQIGGLLNKAKKAAKEKVENKVKKAKNDARNKAEDAAMEKTGMKKADYDPNRKYKPSKEVLAADPQANDQTIQEGFTKSIGDIHACYEQIQDVTLYSPYYTDDAKRFYGIGAEEGTFYNIFFGMFSETLKYDGIHKAYHYPKFTPVNLANDQIQVPCDEFVLNFWKCRFIADPKSEKALKEFVYAYTWLNSMNVKAIRHYAMNLNSG